MTKLFMNSSRAIANLALKVTAMNVNTACIAIIHQPKLPKGADKLRNF